MRINLVHLAAAVSMAGRVNDVKIWLIYVPHQVVLLQPLATQCLEIATASECRDASRSE